MHFLDSCPLLSIIYVLDAKVSLFKPLSTCPLFLSYYIWVNLATWMTHVLGWFQISYSQCFFITTVLSLLSYKIIFTKSKDQDTGSWRPLFCLPQSYYKFLYRCYIFLAVYWMKLRAFFCFMIWPVKGPSPFAFWVGFSTNFK
jgi:hypothetical protein